MSDNKEDLIKALTTGGMVAILTSLIRAVFAKKEGILQRVQVFFGSVFFGLLITLLVRSLELSEFKRELLIIITSGFGYSIWPLMEKIVIKWVTKKGDKIDDLLHDNDN